MIKTKSVQREFWVVVHVHRYGEDAWPVWEQPDLSNEASKIDGFDEEDGEYLSAMGPFRVPSPGDAPQGPRVGRRHND